MSDNIEFSTLLYIVVAYIHHEYEKSCSPSNGQMIDFLVLPLDLLLKIGFLHSL